MDRNDIQNNRMLENDAPVLSENRDDQRQQPVSELNNRCVNSTHGTQNRPEPQPRMQEGNGQGRVAEVPNGNTENHYPHHEPINDENDEAQNAQMQKPQLRAFGKCVETVKKIVEVIKNFANFAKTTVPFLTFMLVVATGFFLAHNSGLASIIAGIIIAICGVLTITPDMQLSWETRCWCFFAEFLSGMVIGMVISNGGGTLMSFQL
ncbi:MAG: hypothetical protein LBF94_01065 [Puniceicoccales bacterium]|nr:hypothetical protein [Puniceicoccales bacterium]